MLKRDGKLATGGGDLPCPLASFSTRPMRFGSRGPFISERSLKCVDHEGLGKGDLMFRAPASPSRESDSE